MSSYEPVQGNEDIGTFTIDDDDENILFDSSENSDDPHAVISQDTSERIIPMEVGEEEGFSFFRFSTPNALVVV